MRGDTSEVLGITRDSLVEQYMDMINESSRKSHGNSYREFSYKITVIDNFMVEKRSGEQYMDSLSSIARERASLRESAEFLVDNIGEVDEIRIEVERGI